MLLVTSSSADSASARNPRTSAQWERPTTAGHRACASIDGRASITTSQSPRAPVRAVAGSSTLVQDGTHGHELVTRTLGGSSEGFDQVERFVPPAKVVERVATFPFENHASWMSPSRSPRSTASLLTRYACAMSPMTE